MKSSTDASLYDSMWSKRQRKVSFTPSGNLCSNDYMWIDFTLAEAKMVKRR